ncbi:hypothetical protein D3C76_1274720 [compost metagenome]
MGEVIPHLQRGILPHRNAGITDIEGIHIDVLVALVIPIAVHLVPGIIADDGEGEFAGAQIDLLHPDPGAGNVPVREIGEVHIVDLIVTFTGPERFVPAKQIRRLHIGLAQRKLGLLVGGRLPVTLLPR